MLKRAAFLGILIVSGCASVTVPTSGTPSKAATVANVVAGPIGYAAVTSAEGYHHPSKISGTCQVRDPAGNFSPCFNATLILSDLEGRELARARVTDGSHFEFLGERDHQYRIAVASEKLRVSSSQTRNLKPGNAIELVLEAI